VLVAISTASPVGEAVCQRHRRCQNRYFHRELDTYRIATGGAEHWRTKASTQRRSKQPTSGRPIEYCQENRLRVEPLGQPGFNGDRISPLNGQPAHSSQPALSNAPQLGQPSFLDRSVTFRSNIASVSSLV